MERNPYRTVCDPIRKLCMRFKPDGCTIAPDFNFRSCCDQHDMHYRLQVASRSEADRELRDCIIAHGHPILGWAYWLAVRLFGWLFWKDYETRNRQAKD